MSSFHTVQLSDNLFDGPGLLKNGKFCLKYCFGLVCIDDVIKAVPAQEGGADHVQGVSPVPRSPQASLSSTEGETGRPRPR